MTRRMSQTGAVRTFARSSRSAAATGSSIPSFRPNRMASSRMRAAISQIFDRHPGRTCSGRNAPPPEPRRRRRTDAGGSGCRQPRSPLSACFAHSRAAQPVLSPSPAKPVQKLHRPAPRGELRLAPDFVILGPRNDTLRTVSTTMSRARSSSIQGASGVPGSRVDERREKLVAHPVHHEIVEVHGIFGHRTGKAVRKARDILDLPVLKPAT